MNDHEFEMYRQSWDTLVYAKYEPKKWRPKQQDVLERVKERTTIDDEDVKKNTQRFLYVKGRPGSGETAVLIEGAVRVAKDGLTVLIVCPTGAPAPGCGITFRVTASECNSKMVLHSESVLLNVTPKWYYIQNECFWM